MRGPRLGSRMRSASTPPVLRESNLGVGTMRRGKVRDVYDLGDKMLMVATDRLSAFDVVLPDGIPAKGVTLTQISNYWFERTKAIVPNHLIATDVKDFPKPLSQRAELKGRSVLVKKAEPLVIECIVRGYLAGSGYKDYQTTGKVCGISLPKGLKMAQKLPQVLFTPSTKAQAGHDINITAAEAKKLVGDDTYAHVEEASIKVYETAAKEALSKGIIIADTKFEFGLIDDEIVLIDEILTPDSSRFWPADEYVVGASPPSFDKQYVRDYLETLDWDKTPPGPRLPPQVIQGTTQRYLEAYRRLTGKDLVF
jgi:phosphoribosylaminoimidazole-succinocarboxamide synthase